MADKGDQSGIGSLVNPTQGSKPAGTVPPPGTTPWVMPQTGPEADVNRVIDAQRSEALPQIISIDYDRIMGFDHNREDSGLSFEDLRVVGSEERDQDNKSLEAVGRMLTMRLNAASAVPDELASELVDFVKTHFEMSHRAIQDRYDYWREAEITHDVYVPASTVDSNGKTISRRMVELVKTPYARAMADTRVTYMLAVFGGSPAFRLEPGDIKRNMRNAKILEQALHQNLRRASWESKVYQMSMDDDRYGMSPMAFMWGEDGNAPINLDPWSYFPDPRVTAQNRQDSDFSGYRSWASKSALYRRGGYANLDKLSAATSVSAWASNRDIRELVRGQSVDPNNQIQQASDPKYTLGKAHVLNTLYVWMDPKQFKINAPFDLYRIVVADEKTIVRFDVSPYKDSHGKIPVIQGEGYYDAHKTFGGGMYDVVMPLQRFQDWLIRARIENVQTVVQNRLVADPTRINLMDILKPNAAKVIRTLPGQTPKDAVFPLQTADITKGFWEDLDFTGQLMQRVTAANDTAQGMQSDTVRTATEIARLTSLGQQRMGTSARMKSATFMREAAEMMIRNLQYFGVDGGIVRLPKEYGGSDSDGWYKWTREEILGRYDYIISDGTLPIDPQENTEILLRALKTISDTGTGQSWDIDFWLEQIIRSMGFYNIEDWKAKGAPQPTAQAAQAATPQTEVVPNEQIKQDLQAGNIIPMSQAKQMMMDPSSMMPQGTPQQ